MRTPKSLFHHTIFRLKADFCYCRMPKLRKFPALFRIFLILKQ